MRSDWSELDQAIWRMNRWAVLFALATVTAVAAGMFGLVGDTGSFVLFLLALGLLVPLSNAVCRKRSSKAPRIPWSCRWAPSGASLRHSGWPRAFGPGG